MIQSNTAQFRRVGDRSDFNLDAGAFGTIQFTQRSLEQLWLFGFSGLFALHCYSEIILLAKSHGLIFNLDEIETIPDQTAEHGRFSKLIDIIDHLNSVKSEHDFTWPIDIPNPANGRACWH